AEDGIRDATVTGVQTCALPISFGDRAALPHARPTGKRLRKNELVVLDLGVILGHYCSDITRTVFVGRAPKRIQTWYKAVLEAQRSEERRVGKGWRERVERYQRR